MELPGGELAVLVDAGGRFDQSGGTEVGPGKLFLAGPDHLHGFAHGLCQPGRLDGGLAGMLAAVAAAGVGNDHPNLVVGQVKGLRQLGANAEGPLGAGPDGQLAALPFGHRGPRLQRCVGDVGDRINRLDLEGRSRQRVLDRTILTRRAVAVASTRPSSSSLARVGMRLEIGRESRSETAGPAARVHSGRSAAMAREATCSLGATTPTKSPSRTTFTSGRASARDVSSDASRAPKAGARSTLPRSMPGRSTSDA